MKYETWRELGALIALAILVIIVVLLAIFALDRPEDWHLHEDQPTRR